MNRDERFSTLIERINKIEVAMTKYAGLPDMVKNNRELREALKSKYGVYPEWTEMNQKKWLNKMKRMDTIKFKWVVELSNLIC